MVSTADRLLDAATRQLRAEGVEALSLRGVAAAVGVTPMAVYRHFHDKDALVDALVARGFGLWEKRLEQAIRARTPMRRIEAVLVAYAEFALAEPKFFELMFLIPRGNIPAAPASLASSPSPSITKLIAALHTAIEQSLIVRREPAQLILTMWGMCHGLIALHFTGRFAGRDDVFRKTYREQVKGLIGLMKRTAGS
jgi:AcrR family transcriptional regulator